MSQALSQTQTLRVGGKTIGATNEITNGAIFGIDEVVPVGTNAEYDISFLAASLKGIVIYAAVACTIKTNSSSEPDDTFTVEAGKPIVWLTGGVASSPITANVTSIFITNAAEGLIQFYAICDPTS